MRSSIVPLFCVFFLALLVMIVVAAELLAIFRDANLRMQVYAGGLAGILLTLAGVPFVAKLTRAKNSELQFWKWWGGGFLARLALLLVLAQILAMHFSEGPTLALLSLAVVYLIGMFSEAACVAAACFKEAEHSTAAGKSGSSEGH